MQAVLQGSTSAAGSKHDAVVINAHILRIYNLIRVDILQNTVLMNTT